GEGAVDVPAPGEPRAGQVGHGVGVVGEGDRVGLGEVLGGGGVEEPGGTLPQTDVVARDADVAGLVGGAVVVAHGDTGGVVAHGVAADLHVAGVVHQDPSALRTPVDAVAVAAGDVVADRGRVGDLVHDPGHVVVLDEVA